MHAAADRSTTCPRCGEAFNCGVETGDCWCGKVVLDEAARISLPPEALCLCQTCLGRLNDEGS